MGGSAYLLSGGFVDSHWFSYRPTDYDCGTGGLWQVLTPPRHPGRDAKDLRCCLLEQVSKASSEPW